MIGTTGLRRTIAKPASALVAGALLASFAAAAQARVARIVIDSQVSPAFNGASSGSAGAYETLGGRQNQPTAQIPDNSKAPKIAPDVSLGSGTAVQTASADRRGLPSRFSRCRKAWAPILPTSVM